MENIEVMPDLPAIAQGGANMFWNDDDPGQQYGSIKQMLNERICHGGLKIGEVLTIQRGIRLSKIKIRVTAVDDEECEAEYEAIAQPVQQLSDVRMA